MTGPDHLASRHRRPGLALAGVLVVFGAMGAGIAALVIRGPDDHVEQQVMAGAAAILLAIGVLFVKAMPWHDWRIGPEGVAITERLALPIWPARRVRLGWAQVAGIARSMAGFDPVLELMAVDGRRFRLSAPRLPGGLADPARLDAFAEALRAHAAAAGHPLGEAPEVAGVFERPAGLALLGVALVLSLGLAGGVAWALVAGKVASPRAAAAAGVLLVLPLGVWALLRRSLRRRAARLDGRQNRPEPCAGRN